MMVFLIGLACYAAIGWATYAWLQRGEDDAPVDLLHAPSAIVWPLFLSAFVATAVVFALLGGKDSTREW